MKKGITASLFDGMDGGAESPSGAPENGSIVRLAFDAGVDGVFDYLLPEQFGRIEKGQRLQAPFGRSNKKQLGFCVETDIEPEKKFRLKKIAAIVDKKPLLDEQLMELGRWISDYYFCPLGQTLAAMVPAAVKQGIGVKKQKFVYLGGIGESEKVTSKKQKQILELLASENASCGESALAESEVLEKIGCTGAPLKSLAQKGMLKFTWREKLNALPAVPQGFSVDDKTDITLNIDQQKAMVEICHRLDSGEFGVSLLHGVTDSGKTEIYIRAVEKAIELGLSAIILLPEIALTAQTVGRFSRRFERVAVMHSGLTAAQRNAQWQMIRNGQADVVIGARSAIFAPLSNLGLVIVDEEHEPSYKQDTVPRYHGRDVAIKRAHLARALCVLGSATPSLESIENCRRREHFTKINLPKRVNDLPMPKISMVDLKEDFFTSKGTSLVSAPLTDALNETLQQGDQAILLLNKRGYSSFVFCPSCKHTLQCRNCDAGLTYHKKKSNSKMASAINSEVHPGYALCHYCMAQTLVPEKCPVCKKKMVMIGLGSQRLEEELSAKFPSARIRRIDSDSMAGGNYYELLEEFAAGKIDILAGTQMLAKGLHFPNVTLVGIISADTCLYIPDFRSNERTFQLISQVAGRTGRSEKPGRVFLQTFLPDQPAIICAAEHDFEGFIKDELEHRKECHFPPFSKMAVILIRDTEFERLEGSVNIIRSRLEKIVAANRFKAIIRGPMPAPISRMHRFHRMQIIIQTPDAAKMQQLMTAIRRTGSLKTASSAFVDVDPINLL